MSDEKRGIPFLLRTVGVFKEENIEVTHKYYDQKSCYHWHDCYEFEYVKSGSVTYYYNGQEYLLPAGSAYLVTPSDHHQVIGHQAELYNIAFNDAQISNELQELILCHSGSTVVNFVGETRVAMEQLLFLLWTEFESKNDLRGYAVRRLFETVLLYFLRTVPCEASAKHSYNSAVMQAVAYIRIHFKQKLTLRQVAAAIHLTPNYLGELFKNELGITFSTYLMKTRLVYARSLLQNKGCTVSEAASAVGFTSQTYFSECFKKEYGYSPTKERVGTLGTMLSAEDE
ncbi:MAG: helix-turn-helix transcriptional regulator [Clostridia bacterium]|nr:helix-turn-helix transcriptional regulator [Clostridia bacterium]